MYLNSVQIIGFVGKEWQRKGLPLVVDIAAQLRLARPNLELWVAGPAPSRQNGRCQVSS